MKLFKILTAALCIFTLAACSSSDDDKKFGWNTKEGVTVSMEDPVIETIENIGLFRIPVQISGNPNGYIKVKFAFTETGDTPAMDDVHYIVTTKELIVNPEDSEVYIEVNTVDNNEDNEPRTFNITIESVEYATIGALAQTEVIIKDKGPYSKLAGTWTMAYLDGQGTEVSGEVKIVCTDPNEKIVLVTGLGDMVLGSSSYDTSLRFNFNWDEVSEHGDVSIPLGYTMVTNVGFRVDGEATPCDLRNILVNGQSPVTYGEIEGTCNANYSSITFPEGAGFYIGVFITETGEFIGTFDAMSDITLTRSVEE